MLRFPRLHYVNTCFQGKHSITKLWTNTSDKITVYNKLIKISIIDINIKCWYQKQLIKMSNIENVIIWHKYQFWQNINFGKNTKFDKSINFDKTINFDKNINFETNINIPHIPHLIPLPTTNLSIYLGFRTVLKSE